MDLSPSTPATERGGRSRHPEIPRGDRIGVHARRVLSGEGCLVQQTVFCPVRERTLELDECAECADCAGLESAASRPFVVCRRLELQPSCDHCRSGSHVVTGWRQRPGFSRATSAGRTPLAAIMSADVVCVEADVGVGALTGFVLERGIGGLPVVDESCHPVGMITKTDLVRDRYESTETLEVEAGRSASLEEAELGAGYHEERIARATVAEIMSPQAFTLPESAPVAQAAALMAHEGVHRVPVVGQDGRIVGIVSSLDVLRWLAREDGWVIAEPG